MSGEQSNTSIVYDERIIVKIFRRLPPGPNPDAEITRALASVGFENVAPPIAEWRGDDTDYAVANGFLVGAADGFHLALTSLRDLYDRRCDPVEAGGDFGPEAGRLGDITGRMHVALAQAFGPLPADVGSWLADMQAQLDRVRAASAIYRRVAALDDVGPAIRIHGDYHLGQVVRTDAGWYVLDFEGEPDRPLEERRRPSSPMRDVAGMLRSFDYAAQVALVEWGDEADAELRSLGRAWQQHNADAFLAGYLGAEGVETVLPRSDDARLLLLAAFELDKAVYEVGYERAHRPDWVEIPLSAVRRILDGVLTP
jgi:maltokinase